MLLEVFRFYFKDDGELIKDIELGSELIRFMFWKDFSIVVLRVDGLWLSVVLCDIIYKCFKIFL